jgi:hypothetical protein
METSKPQGWGEDPLSSEIDLAEGNIHSVFRDQRAIFDLLVHAQEIFNKLKKSLKSGLTSKEGVTFLFLSMSHGAYLGAVRLALGGQLAPSYMVMRGCLENALYAFRIYKNPKLFKIYKDRYKGNSEKKESRNKFNLADIFCELNNHCPEIGGPAKDLYDSTIDLGAHPNVMAIKTNLHFDEEKREYQFSYITDQSRDPIPFVQCVEMIIWTAGYSLKIFEIIFEKIVSEQNLSDAIEELTRTSIKIES